MVGECRCGGCWEAVNPNRLTSQPPAQPCLPDPELAQYVEIFDLGVILSTLNLGVTISVFDLGDTPVELGRESTRVGEGADSRLTFIITVGLVIDEGLSLVVSDGSLLAKSKS